MFSFLFRCMLYDYTRFLVLEGQYCSLTSKSFGMKIVYLLSFTKNYLTIADFISLIVIYKHILNL